MLYTRRCRAKLNQLFITRRKNFVNLTLYSKQKYLGVLRNCLSRLRNWLLCIIRFKALHDGVLVSFRFAVTQSLSEEQVLKKTTYRASRF